MNKKALWQYRWERIKEFVPKLSKKGSPTLEYVVIIAAGAALAGLLLAAFKDGSQISSTLQKKVQTVIDQSGPKTN